MKKHQTLTHALLWAAAILAAAIVGAPTVLSTLLLPLLAACALLFALPRGLSRERRD
jgi:hypothetical protein